MRIPFLSPRPSRLERLDRYLARKQYRRALAVLDSELARRPDSLDLVRRRAEVLTMAGQRERASEAYRALARAYVHAGLHARAVAIYKQMGEMWEEEEDLDSTLVRMILGERAESAAGPPARLAVAEGPGGTALAAAPTNAGPAADERAGSSFFTLFEPAVLERLLSSTAVRTFQPGEVILIEGETGESLFLIVEGQVEVFTRGTSGEPVPLTELGPGHFFGEVAVLSGNPRTATIAAKTAVSAVEVGREEIEAIAAEHPAFKETLLRFCEERAQATIEALTRRRQGGRVEEAG